MSKIDDQDLPLFLQPWFLEVACSTGEKHILSNGKSGDQESWMPVYIKKKGPFRYITQPLFSQFHGPVLRRTLPEKNVARISQEEKDLESLLDSLEKEKVHSYSQCWSPGMTNWYPFYKRGYSMEMRFTYVIKDCSDSDRLWKDMKGSTRTDIRKAEKLLTVEKSENSDELFSIEEKTFSRQHLAVPFSREHLKLLVKEAHSRGQAELLLAKDSDKRTIAAALILWDKDKSYYLLGGADPEFRGAAPQSLLIWQALKSCSQRGQAFDFEGSMVPGIERAFRSFGGERVPYLKVWKHYSRPFKWMKRGRG